MKYLEGAVTEAMKRAQWFLADHRDELGKENPAEFERAQQKVDEVLANLLKHGVDQDGGRRGASGETAKQRQLRLDIRSEWLRPIAVIARRNLRQVPEFIALQLPKPSKRGHAFTASARAMVAAAAVHREALARYGLPETFVEDLNKAVDQFEASLADRDSYEGRRVTATKGLEAETREARTVLTVLDALVRRWAKGDAVLQRGWEGARHIRRRPGPVSAPSGSPAAEPTAANERPIAIA